MKNIYRIISLILVACMVFSLTACRNSGDEWSFYSEVYYEDVPDSNDDSNSDDATANDDEVTNSDDGSNDSKDNNQDNNDSKDNKDDKDDKDNNTSTVTPPSKREIKDLKGTTVDVLWWQEPTTEDRKLFENFEKKYDIKVNIIQTTESEYNTRLSNMIIAKEGLDVALIKNFPFTTVKCFQPTSVMGVDAKDKFWNQQVTDKYSIQGKSYGLAADKGLWYNNFQLLFYDEDIFVANGVTTPRELWEDGNWNWDTFYEVASDIHKSDPEIGVYFAFQTPFMDVIGQDFVTYDGKTYKDNSTNPEIIKAWQYYTKFLDAGLCTNVSVGEDFSLRKGNLAMMYVNSWGTRKDSHGNDPGTLDCVPFPAPKGQEGKILYTPQIWGCPKGADNELAAGLFLEYILDNDNYPAKMEDVVINENMASTLKWVLNNTDKFYLQGQGDIIGYTISERSRGAIAYKLQRTAASQITTIIAEYKQSIDGSVKEANKIVG